jgi:hypothetical protein
MTTGTGWVRADQRDGELRARRVARFVCFLAGAPVTEILAGRLAARR